MPDRSASEALQRQFETLQADHPDLDPVAVLIVLALHESDVEKTKGTTAGVSTALLSRRLGIEHALIRRACAELEAADWIATEPVGGASPALRVISIRERPPADAQPPNE